MVHNINSHGTNHRSPISVLEIRVFQSEDNNFSLLVIKYENHKQQLVKIRSDADTNLC